MAGQHLNDLLRRANGMEPDDVDRARRAWDNNAGSLESVGRRLKAAAPRMLAGFGADSEIGREANATFIRAGERVLERGQQLKDAATALEAVAEAMSKAKAAAADPPSDPGAPPPPPAAIGETRDDLTALKIHAARMRSHTTAANAFADADEDARLKVQALRESYTEASGVLAKIHGDPYIPPPPGGGDEPGRTPGTVPLPGTRRLPTPVRPIPDPNDPDRPDRPDDPDRPDRPDDTDRPPLPIEDPTDVDDPTIPGPDNPTDSGDPTGPVPGGRSGNGALIGGLAGAGLLGTTGVVSGIRNALAGRGLSASSRATIGATSRTGGPGSLGRPGIGAATPGSQVGRNAGRAGTGGRGGAGGRPGVATPGNGAGGRGGRGAGAAGAATSGRGRGRKNQDDTGADRDLFDDGQDWLDDDGAAPSVLD